MPNTAPFTLPLLIVPEDIDALGHVNNVVYLRWVQDIAAAHWATLSSHASETDAVWVVLRHEIDYLKAAVLGDELIGKTWVGETDRLRSIRHVVIEKTDGTIVAKAQTTWCMMQTRTGQVKRISPQIMDLLKGL